MSRVATDGLYIELDYLTPEEYYAYVAEAEARLGYYYIDPGYIDADYYDDSPGVVATLSCELTLVVGEVKEFDAALSSTASVSASASKIVEASADIASAMAFSTTIFVTRYGDIDLYSLFTQSAGADRIRDNDITLDTLVSLSLQGDRTRAFDTALSASSTLAAAPSLTKYLSSTQNATSTFTASATVTKELTSTLAATATVNASPDTLELFDAALSSTFTQTTSAYIANRRPRPYTTVGTPIFSTDVKKWGTHSTRVSQGNYLTLPGSTDWKSWKTFDFWAKPYDLSNGEQSYIFTHGFNPDTGTWYDSNNFFYIMFQSVATPNYYYIEVWQRINGISTRFRSSYVITTAWNHYRITRDTNGINMWIDGVKVTAPLLNNSVSTHPNIDTGATIGNNIVEGSNRGFYLDELYISKSILTSSGTSSFTVPTAEWRLTGTEQNNTILLSHYDGTFEDYTGAWEQGAAALTANNTLSALGSASLYSASDLSATSTVSVDANKTIPLNAGLDSTSTQTATVGKLLEGAADITSQNNFSLTATSVKEDSVYIETLATLSASASITKGNSAALASTAALTAQESVTRTVTATLASTATQTATLIGSVYSAATLASTASLTAIPDVFLHQDLFSAWLNTNNSFRGVAVTTDQFNNVYGLGISYPNSSTRDLLVVKVDAQGNLLWQNSYNDLITTYSVTAEIFEDSNTLYVVAGTNSGTLSDTDDATWIFKIDVTDGSLLSAKRYYSRNFASASLYNGNIYITGRTPYTASLSEMTVASIATSDLTVNWAKTVQESADAYTYPSIPEVIAGPTGVFTFGLIQTTGGTRYTSISKFDTSGTHSLTKRLSIENTPTDAEIDSSGDLILAAGSKILKLSNIDLSLTWAKTTSVTDINNDTRIAVDEDDYIYYVDNSVVRKINPSGTQTWSRYVEFADTDINNKGNFIQTVGDGYWESIVSDPYDRVRNIWIQQIPTDGDGIPFTGQENYAGSDGIWTYDVDNSTISSQSVTEYAMSVDVANTSITTGAVSVSPVTTNYDWIIVARVIYGTSHQSAQFVQPDTDFIRYRGFDSAQEVLATQSTTGTAIKALESSLSSTTTSSATAVLTADRGSVIEANGTLTADLGRIRGITADVTSTVTMTANAVIFAGSQTILHSNFTQSDIDIGRIRDYDIDVAAISIELVSAAKVGSALVTISTSSTLAASPTKDASVIVSGSVATTLEADAFRVAEASAEITANATFNLIPTKIKAVQAALSSTSTASAIPSRTRPASSDLSSTTVAQIQPNRTRDNSSVLNTTAEINATGLLVKFGVLNLTSQFDHVFILTKRVGGEAHISADGFILVAGRPIHIDTYYQLIVPAESRTIKVLEESRTFVVEEETRVLMI